MPYKHVSMKMPREFDRRVKLSDNQRNEIREKYKSGMYSLRALGREYSVDKKTIKFIIDEDYYEKSKEAFRERRKDGRYNPTKEERAAIMRDHIRYKQNLYLKGLLEEG